jgi:hypothetical protein
MKKAIITGVALLVIAVGCVAFGLYLTLTQPDGLRSFSSRGDPAILVTQGTALIFLVIGLLATIGGVTSLYDRVTNRRHD